MTMTNEQASNYEGSIIMQAIVSHEIGWSVVGGNTEEQQQGNIQFDPASVKTKLHQVDVYPDMSYDSGHAQSTYVVYDSLPSQHAILEAFDRWLTNYVSTELMNGETVDFKTLNYNVKIITNKVVLRGLTSGDTQRPQIVFKASSDFVNKFENEEINNWNNVNVQISGDFGKLELNVQSDPNLEDVIDENGVMIIEQILPSLKLSFHAEQTVDSKEDK